jgi:hypothetical protein
MTIIELHDNLKRMQRPDAITKRIVISDGDVLVELVKEQMQQGNRGGVQKDVARLGWYTPKGGWQSGKKYAPSAYALMKHEMNAKPGLGIVDLKLTGAFYNSFYFYREDLEVTSTDSKTSDLLDRYGENIFKFTPETINKYREIFNQKFWENIWAGIRGEQPPN